MRKIENTTNDNGQRTCRYPDEGITDFYIKGYVQSVAQNHKYHQDYLRFCIKNNPEDEFYDVVSVTLPHKLGFAMDVGDHIEVWGYIKSWNRDGKVSLELIAEGVKEVNDGAEELNR